MTISGTTATDAKLSYANYGPCVDWFAPADKIVSAAHQDDTAMATKSGTSMGTPHTTGVAAQYLQTNPAVDAQAVRDVLYANTTKNQVTSSNTANNHLLFTNY